MAFDERIVLMNRLAAHGTAEIVRGAWNHVGKWLSRLRWEFSKNVVSQQCRTSPDAVIHPVIDRSDRDQPPQ